MLDCTDCNCWGMIVVPFCAMIHECLMDKMDHLLGVILGVRGAFSMRMTSGTSQSI